MSQEIRTIAEIYETINHTNVMAIAGGLYIGMFLGICFVFYVLHRYKLEFVAADYTWIMGIGILSLILGVGLLIKSNIKLSCE